MARGLTPDDRRIWSRVAATLDTTRKPAPVVEPEAPARPPAARTTMKPRPTPPGYTPPRSTPAPRPHPTPEELEPRRQRRLARERDQIDARIDLHGHGRFQAQDALTAFLTGAQARGHCAVLVITGQGRRDGGVIRASVHEWLTAHALRGVVSGFAPAHRRHGGDGAIYVTLKRRG